MELQDNTTERRLWLEYLSKLNDRDLQQARSSGVTTWVLLGVAGALLYKIVPAVEALDRPSLVNCGIVFILLTDCALFFMPLYAEFMSLFSLGEEKRLLPNRFKKGLDGIQALYLSTLGLLTIGNVAYARHLSGYGLQHIGIWAICVAMGGGTVFGIVDLVWRKLNARKYKHPVPYVDLVDMYGKNVPGVGLIPFGTAVALLFSAVKNIGPHWVFALSAGAHCFALLVVIILLVLRDIKSTKATVYRNLERDIVLRRLDPDEIHRRFVQEACGPSVADWLRTVSGKIEEAESGIRSVLSKCGTEIESMERIQAEYGLERVGRMGQVLEQVERTATDIDSLFQWLEFQMRYVEKMKNSVQDKAMFREAASELEKRYDAFAAQYSEFKAMVKRLRCIASRWREEVPQSGSHHCPTLQT